MTSDLGASIAEAYQVFSRYRIGGDLVVCHCNCCMSEQTEHELIATPVSCRWGKIAKQVSVG